jgi:hypothetical protein
MTAPAPRQPKLTRDELRSLLLETGRILLIEEGMGTGVDHLTFKRVFDRVEADTGRRLSNASVIRRVWDNLADYQADVLVTIATQDGLGEFESTFAALIPVLASMDLSTPEARDRSLREACRVGGSANITVLLESPDWWLWITVWSLAMADIRPGDDDREIGRRQRLRDALSEGYESVTGMWEDAYTALVASFGLRPRPPLTVRQFTVAIGALAEGCSLRQRLDPGMVDIMRPTGPGGGMQAWTLFGLALEALVHQFFEPDPGWVAPPAG